MKLQLYRKDRQPTYTIGDLFIDDIFVCNTLEDTERFPQSNPTLEEIKAIKIKGATAIPCGTYVVTLKVQSPKFSLKPFYKEFCNGYLPRLLNVLGYDGILIHVGNYADAWIFYKNLTFDYSKFRESEKNFILNVI
jgi:hypothetical protein